MSTNKFTNPTQPQQANQTATKDPILDGIIDRTTTANHQQEPQKADAPVINVTAATALTPADDGKIDYESLVRLRAHMNGDLGVIPWPDGCYVLVAHPNAIVDLELELTRLSKPISRMNVEEVTNTIEMVNTAITDKISGYRFTVGGFHIFTHENLPPDPAFMTSSTGAAATLRNWYDNIAFGPMAVCECISMAPEVRRDEIRNFGTQDRYIWLMYGKYQAIERGAGIGQRSQIVKFRSGKA
jgi:hypothetical protein